MANYLPVASGTADAQIFTGKGKLLGLSARETAATAAVATFALRDGTSAAAPMIAAFELTGDEAINGDWGDIDGIEFGTGLYLDRIAGTTEVTVYV